MNAHNIHYFISLCFVLDLASNLPWLCVSNLIGFGEQKQIFDKYNFLLVNKNITYMSDLL